jgi:dihydroxy-acid dehydratase
MYLRNLMAMDTEEMIRAQPMDRVVVIGGCDKTLPAQIMARSAPICRPSSFRWDRWWSGITKGEVLGACTDCRRLWGKYRAGEIDDVEIEAVNGRLAPSVGTCMVMGTASTMACITEALGLSLPMSATIPGAACRALSVRRSQRQGRRRDGEGQGTEAQRVPDQGLVPQCAGRAAGDRRLDQRAHSSHRDRQPHRTPHRSRRFRRARPRGPGADRLETVGRSLHGAFHHAGGLPKLMAQLGDLIDLDAKTITGATLRDVVAAAEDVPGQDVIRTRQTPIKPEARWRCCTAIWRRAAPS